MFQFNINFSKLNRSFFWVPFFLSREKRALRLKGERCTSSHIIWYNCTVCTFYGKSVSEKLNSCMNSNYYCHLQKRVVFWLALICSRRSNIFKRSYWNYDRIRENNAVFSMSSISRTFLKKVIIIRTLICVSYHYNCIYTSWSIKAERSYSSYYVFVFLWQITIRRQDRVYYNLVLLFSITRTYNDLCSVQKYKYKNKIFT